jgi:hypothetical protein
MSERHRDPPSRPDEQEETNFPMEQLELGALRPLDRHEVQKILENAKRQATSLFFPHPCDPVPDHLWEMRGYSDEIT